MAKTSPTREGFLSVNTPFDGFYESLYSDAVDSHEEREAEYREEQDKAEEPLEHLRLSASEYADLMFECADYRKIYGAIAHAYADAFNNLASEELGFDLGLEYDSMESPRFYNYGTDRLFSYIPIATAQKLFEMSTAEDHAALDEYIKARFTSRSGFSSNYKNKLNEWIEKPLVEWDHNELGALLRAVLNKTVDKHDFREKVYYATFDRDGVTHEYDAGFDYTAFDTRVQELKKEKGEAFERGK